MIKSYSHGDDPHKAFGIFGLMVENGILVDKFTFSLVLKACAKVGFLREGMQIHGLLMKCEIGSDLFLRNCLVCLYLKCGCFAYARQLFDRMQERDSVSFNLMIDGCVKLGMIGLAREVFDSMPGEARNLISWNSMICGYAQLEGGFELAWDLFEKMPERDLVSYNMMILVCVRCRKMDIAHALFKLMPERDVITWANMIDGYAKLGRIDIARAFFDKMPERDVISCNTMMAGYVHHGFYGEALKLFHDMKTIRYFSLDDTTLSIVLSAIGQLGCLDEGLAIHRYVKEHGLTLEGKLGVALIDMYSNCGSIDNAKCIFEGVHGKGVDHWNAMIGGLAIQGCGESAFALFMEMERYSVIPDDITFIGVLSACAHGGLVKEGMICFELMRRVHKVKPKAQHYGCVADILARAGHIEQAKKFVDEMPIQPNDVVLRTLLGACKVHENFTIGEHVAGDLIELDSFDSSDHVLLSNIYAGYGMWNEVRKIRTSMKEKELDKLPGCSWIELDGMVHNFFAGDKSNTHIRDVYSSLVNALKSEPNGFEGQKTIDSLPLIW